MPTDSPDNSSRRYCPVCWTPFTPNSPKNPYRKQYCCGACRIEDSRRRRQQAQSEERRPPMNPA